jgi:hypothetical protein
MALVTASERGRGVFRPKQALYGPSDGFYGGSRRFHVLGDLSLKHALYGPYNSF